MAKRGDMKAVARFLAQHSAICSWKTSGVTGKIGSPAQA